MKVGSIHWNYQEISLKQINKRTVFFMHHKRELMECFAIKGWGDRQDQQVQKRISTNSWTWDPQSHTAGNKHVHPLQHSQRKEHGCRQGEDDISSAALCSALNLPQYLNAAPLWTFRMFLPLFILIQASSIPSSAGNVIFSSKKSIVMVTFPLETPKFCF